MNEQIMNSNEKDDEDIEARIKPFMDESIPEPNKKEKEEITQSSENSENQIISISDQIMEKKEKIIKKINEFKTMFESLNKKEQNSNGNSNSSSGCQETTEVINKIDSNFQTLNVFINEQFDEIRKQIENLKNNKESESCNSLTYINPNQKVLTEFFNKIDREVSEIQLSYEIKKIEGIQYVLYNQYEIVKYNENYNLLINILNNGYLSLILLGQNDSKVKSKCQIDIHIEDIKEIRCFSGKINDEDNCVIKNYLFVSSKNNKLYIFEIIEIGDSFDDGKNPLQFITIIDKLYPEESENNHNLILSSFALRIQSYNLEIFTTFLEGKYINIYTLIHGKLKTQIKLKSPFRINYCEIVEEKYFIFCGICKNNIFFDEEEEEEEKEKGKSEEEKEKEKNEEEKKEICAICVKLDEINFDNRENLLYSKKCIKYNIIEDNYDKGNIPLNLRYFKKENDRYLIICDEKGNLRIFNFDKGDFIKKICYSDNDTDYKEIFNSFYWFKEISGNIILIKKDNGEEINFENGFRLNDTEIISYKKYVIKDSPSENIVLSIENNSNENK